MCGEAVVRQPVLLDALLQGLGVVVLICHGFGVTSLAMVGETGVIRILYGLGTGKKKRGFYQHLVLSAMLQQGLLEGNYPSRSCEICPSRARYKHIHVRSGSAIHGLTRSWKGIFHSCDSLSWQATRIVSFVQFVLFWRLQQR
jgi:hypothetical protein